METDFEFPQFSSLGCFVGLIRLERNLVNTFQKRAAQAVCFTSFLLLMAVAAAPAKAQSQELTFSLGGIPGQSRGLEGSSSSALISADRTFGINYAHRLTGIGFASLYAEIEFVAIPNRPVSAATAVVPRNYASLYLTPGVQLKFFPGSRVSPWAAVGGGYALYQQSAQLSNGQDSSNKFLNRGVFDYGGGLDYRLFRFIGLRGEVRDFFSGNPNLNTTLGSSTQHNVVASGGIILRF
jgi:hypothetical protein